MEHDTSPNLFEAVHVHPLHVAIAHKSKVEVSLVVAQISVKLVSDYVTQQSQNI